MAKQRVALTATPEHLLPEGIRKDPFKDLKEEYIARNRHPDHPDGHLPDGELKTMLADLERARQKRIECLKIVAHHMRLMLGISSGLNWKDFDVAWGIVSDGKWWTLFHLGNPALDRALKAYGPALRATDAFNAPGETRLELAIVSLPVTRRREDGTIEEAMRPLCLPLDFVGAVQRGWLDLDIEEDGLFYMPATREAADRMHRLVYPNIAFFRNMKGGGDRSRAFLGNHSESGKLVFAVHVPPECVNEQGTKVANQKRIGVEVVERLTFYEVARVHDGTFSETLSNEEWVARQKVIATNLWKADMTLEKRRAFQPHHVRVGCMVFDARVLLGLSTEVPLTKELVEAAKEKGKLSKGGATHAKQIAIGTLVLPGFSCRAPVEKGKEWLEANAQSLFDAALARLEAMVAPKLEAPKTEPARGERASAAAPPADKPADGTPTDAGSAPAAATESSPSDES